MNWLLRKRRTEDRRPKILRRRFPSSVFGLPSFVFFLLSIFLNSGAFSQSTTTLPKDSVKVIDIYNADMLTGYNVKGKSYQKLVGRVVLHHDGAMMFCDSAIISDADNIARAYGHIHIQQGDSLDMYGEEMEYEGNKKIATLKKKVRLIDKQLTLNSEQIVYDRNAGMAYYGDSSTTQTSTDNLTSKKGYYYVGRKEFAFKGDVVMVNKDYVINTDTMIYNTVKDITYFKGPSTIVSKESYIYCENGWYDKINDKAQFNKNAYVIAENNILKGDSLYYERKRGFGTAIGNVSIEDTVENITIYGQYAETEKNIERYLVTDSAQMVQVFDDGDSLFLHADTLLAVEDTLGKRVLNCFHHVKFFKSDMSGACDSMTYTQADSLIKMFYKPVLWNEENQITAENININIGKSKIYWMEMLTTALIIQQVDSVMFNQIGGDNMKGSFRNNELSKVDVFGGGKTIYYPDQEDGSVIGMNKVECIDITIYINDRKFDKIIFKKKPVGVLEPLDKINPADFRLDGFEWLDHKRPKNRWDIFIWP
jgi:lipopolysaccharide export system protein LptA